MKEVHLSCPRCHETVKLPARSPLPKEGTCPRCQAKVELAGAKLANKPGWDPSAVAAAEILERLDSFEARMDALADRVRAVEKRLDRLEVAPAPGVDRREVAEQIESLAGGLAAIEADLGARSEVLRRQLESLRRTLDPGR